MSMHLISSGPNSLQSATPSTPTPLSGLTEEQACPVQSHTRCSALAIHKSISQLPMWHKGRQVAISREREMGLGEREGNADRSMGKEKMNFAFLGFKRVLLKPVLSTLIGTCTC